MLPPVCLSRHAHGLDDECVCHALICTLARLLRCHTKVDILQLSLCSSLRGRFGFGALQILVSEHEVAPGTREDCPSDKEEWQACNKNKKPGSSEEGSFCQSGGARLVKGLICRLAHADGLDVCMCSQVQDGGEAHIPGRCLFRFALEAAAGALLSQAGDEGRRPPAAPQSSTRSIPSVCV